jgi:PTH1 family peptidyl-tRNA hydrolase
MKAIVGLGNPGARYRRTRHNVGFDVLEELGRRFLAPAPRSQFEAEIRDLRDGDERVLLVAPQTYMNESGRSVRKLVDFYQLAPPDLLVVCDDLNLDCGRLRLRTDGSAGGQKGLQDIIRHLGTDVVPRLRIGIGRPPGRMDAADYVLSRFSEAEAKEIEIAVKEAADACRSWWQDGAPATMNRINGPRA